MKMTDILAQMGGLQSIAQELGVSESQVASGAEALTPAILGGVKKQSQSADAEGLGGLLGKLGGGSLLDNVLSPEATDVSRGNDVLGNIFGSKDVSRAVVQNAASQSGQDPTLLKQMLPRLAMLVTGYMAKQPNVAQASSSSARGGIGKLLGGLFGGKRAAASSQQNADDSGLFSMLDMDGDGNPLDDILQVVGRTPR